ncbi:MAG: helix-turn-helix domain-containing protein [Candidatus Shapirobacteria bacterium]
MLTTWEYSVKTEAERLIHVAHSISNGFFKTNNFVVLPYSSNSKNSSIVTFPDLPYQKISRFWKTVKTIDVDNLPLKIDPKLADDVKKMVVDNKLNTAKFEKIKILWEEVETEVINEIYKVIPSKANFIKQIIIFPTVFGTNCSFNWRNDFGEIFIYLRQDQGIHAIVEAIITSITREDVYEKLDGVWAESEIITDYLVTQTSIGQVLQKYEKTEMYLPTLKGIRGKEQLKLIQESDEFYKKLGIQIEKKQFSVNDFENLTETEKNLLNTLIKNENQITDFDTIGGAIFKNDDDFSLYAISKTIQRLRDKFEANGISGSYIQTLRGKGYVLKN